MPVYRPVDAEKRPYSNNDWWANNFRDQSRMTWPLALCSLLILEFIRLCRRYRVWPKLKSRWMVICHALFIPSNLLLKLVSLHVPFQIFSGTNWSCLFDRRQVHADGSQSSSKLVQGCSKTCCRSPFVFLDLIEWSWDWSVYSSVTLPLHQIYSEVMTK